MKGFKWLTLLVALLAVALAVQQRAAPAGGPLDRWLQHPVVVSVIKTLQTGRLVTAGEAAAGCACRNVTDPSLEEAACNLSGNVTDCCCTYAAVERVNRYVVKPLLDELVRTPFLQYFKVDLYCECPLWPDDGMCSLRDCSVCECEAHEVPEPWRRAEAVDSCDSAQRESDVDRTMQPSIKARLRSVRDWRGYRNPWMPEGDESVEYSYINLLRNPEKYTGYKGEHANRVWAAIYGQKIFEDIHSPDTPPEKRVFYKLISGMHSSITAHIVGDYLIDEAQGIWGPNVEMFKWRLGNPAVQDRVENLYFAYLFVLRAVMKAAPILDASHYDTGSPEEDARTQQLVHSLVDNEALKRACPIPFDEGRLWRSSGAAELRAELQSSFQNITRVMDCVGCEKCKMWGKLQLLGIATSLKVLFSAEDCGGQPAEGGGIQGLQLERNEVIALLNLLERLSLGVEVVRDLSLQLAGNGERHPGGLGAVQEVTKSPPLPEQLRQT